MSMTEDDFESKANNIIYSTTDANNDDISVTVFRDKSAIGDPYYSVTVFDWSTSEYLKGTSRKFYSPTAAVGYAVMISNRHNVKDAY